MSLVTFERYQAITGDTATAEAAVTSRLEEAVEKLEEDLCRPLEAVERVEAMWPDRCGWLYPTATPITVATGWTIDGHALRGGSWPIYSWPESTDSVLVTYTGGYVERTANPDASNRLPVCMERDIAWAAYALEHPDLFTIPTGATAVSVGDLSVSFGGGGTSRSGDDLTIRWSRATRRFQRRGV